MKHVYTNAGINTIKSLRAQGFSWNECTQKLADLGYTKKDGDRYSPGSLQTMVWQWGKKSSKPKNQTTSTSVSVGRTTAQTQTTSSVFQSCGKPPSSETNEYAAIVSDARTILSLKSLSPATQLQALRGILCAN